MQQCGGEQFAEYRKVNIVNIDTAKYSPLMLSFAMVVLSKHLPKMLVNGRLSSAGRKQHKLVIGVIEMHCVGILAFPNQLQVFEIARKRSTLAASQIRPGVQCSDSRLHGVKIHHGRQLLH